MVNKLPQQAHTTPIRSFLTSLGFSRDEVKIYSELLKLGTSSVMTLAKKTGINRTTIYRRLEDMQQKGLVEFVVEDKRIVVQPVAIDQLEHLLDAEKRKIELLQESFKDLRVYMAGQKSLQQPDTKVLFYKGRQGIRQMVLHTLRARIEVVGYTYRDLAEIVGQTFMERWREEFLVLGLQCRDVYSDHYIISRLNNPRKIDYPKDRFPSKYFPNKILNIDYQTDIYNDVVAYYNWFEGDVFGVEIYNAKVAKLQKSLFEILWKIGQEPPDTKLV